MNRARVRCTARAGTLLTSLALAMTLLMLGAGCGKSRRVETRVRDDGATTHTLSNNEIKVEGAVRYHAEFAEGNYSIEKRIVLDVEAIEKPGETASYALLMTYMGANELHIEPGRSLEVIADLNSHVLSADGETQRVRDPSGEFFTERLRYPVSAAMLGSMADAEVVRVVVKGRDGDARGYFDETNLAGFRSFVADYVPQSARPTP